VNSFGNLYHIARADFLERLRRYSFLATMLFAVYLGYASGSGLISMRVSEHRGVYTSGWIGTMVALVAGCFVSLAGFYMVKSAVDRDRATGVGQILAATPLTKLSYLLGKWFSNTAVLLAQVAILAVAAGIMFALVGESQFNLWALLSPFLLLSLPMMALTGALALVFETVPVLRSGAGNVIFFFAWSSGLAVPIASGLHWFDPLGIVAVVDSIVPAARAAIPGYVDSFSLRATTDPIQVARGLRWEGVQWTPAGVLLRVGWIAVAFLMVLVAAVAFDRFGSARTRRVRNPRPVAGEPPAPRAATADVHLTPLPARASRPAFLRLFTAELRLALQGYRWWWYAVALGLLVAQCAAPMEVARGPLLAVSWIWPLLAWSAMGVREVRYATGQVIFSSAHNLTRQFPACWVAGVAVAVVAGAGAGFRLALAGNAAGIVAWGAGAVFIPTLALALGVWTRSSRAFEALFTILWYTGPLNRIRGLDFTGFANGARTMQYAALYLLLAMALFGVALLGRKRQALA
jgi:ABC-type multidrug transport system permease subunit